MTINKQEIGTKPTDKPGKNLLFIIGRLSPVGGEERSLTLLCNELARRDAFDITIACMDGDKTEFPLDERINLVYLNSPKIGRFKTLTAIRELVLQREIHIIVGYGFMTRPLLGTLGIFQKTPIIFCERITPFSVSYTLKQRIKQFISICMLRGKHAVFQTDSVAGFYKKLKSYAVIPNMLDVDALPAVNKWVVRGNKIICAARLAPQKNLSMLISAFLKAREAWGETSPACQAQFDYSLEIYGEGELEAELKELTAKQNADSYIKIEPVTADIHNHMNAAKIYVCSSDAEGYSNALLEAMAMGMACISTDCSGSVRDMIQDGVSGLIVPVGDIEAMSEALGRLMQDDETAKKMASRAVTVRETNAKDKIVDKWISDLDEIIQ